MTNDISLRDRILAELRAIDLPLTVRAELPYGVLADAAMRAARDDAALMAHRIEDLLAHVGTLRQDLAGIEQAYLWQGIQYVVRAMESGISHMASRYAQHGAWPDTRTAMTSCRNLARAVGRRTKDGTALPDPEAEGRHLVSNRLSATLSA